MIIAKLTGGIGNQMFQYAAAKRVSLKNNTVLKLDLSLYDKPVWPNGLPYRSFDLSIFDLEINIASKKEIALFKSASSSIAGRITKKIRNTISPHTEIIEPHFHFFPELLNAKGNLYLDGYWQCEKYFKDIEDIVRKDFTIRTSLNVEGLEMLEKIKNTNSVCLNVRRQEFASNLHINQFVGENYIQEAIGLIAEKVDNPHFFIISDELEWCKQNIKTGHPHTFVEEHLYGERFKDCLFFMTSCKHFIIPNSTFGWWGAWLSNNPGKVVIAPQKWLSDPKRNTKDVIPESWIRI